MRDICMNRKVPAHKQSPRSHCPRKQALTRPFTRPAWEGVSGIPMDSWASWPSCQMRQTPLPREKPVSQMAASRVFSLRLILVILQGERPGAWPLVTVITAKGTENLFYPETPAEPPMICPGLAAYESLSEQQEDSPSTLRSLLTALPPAIPPSFLLHNEFGVQADTRWSHIWQGPHHLSRSCV